MANKTKLALTISGLLTAMAIASPPVFAETNSPRASTEDLKRQIETLQQSINALQKQVETLQQENIGRATT
ncbi:MAG: hypothetical protein LBE06_07920, partial [Azoarcus sp.]|nr:hypothetical protein [Azoarcus sp.]